MFASLFGDSQLHWLQNATEYWARMDRLLDSIEDRGLYVLPSIGSSDWYMLANAASAANETKYDLVVNSSSVSRALALRYFGELVGRWVATPGSIVRPIHEGLHGHPVIFPSDLQAELASVDEATEGVRAVMLCEVVG